MVAIDEDDPTPAFIFGQLESYRSIRTPFTHSPDGGPERQIYLQRGDHVCSACDEIIPCDSYGEGAPVILILGRQKRKYGETHCAGCLAEVQGK